jgi:hypothetical protein
VFANPYCSILVIDLGPLAIPVGEPPESLRGWRQLTVYSPWRIQTPESVLFDWNVDGGPSGLLPNLVKSIVGARVVRAATRPPAWDLEVHWSDGSALVVFGDITNDRDTAWFVLGMGGEAVSAKPSVKPLKISA